LPGATGLWKSRFVPTFRLARRRRSLIVPQAGRRMKASRPGRLHHLRPHRPFAGLPAGRCWEPAPARCGRVAEGCAATGSAQDTDSRPKQGRA
jgi:hypothetical protein